MDVLRGIDISLVLGATFGAHPFTDSKRKGVEDMSTGKATFRGGIPLVNLHQVPAVPLRFVGQNTQCETDTGVSEGLRRFRETVEMCEKVKSPICGATYGAAGVRLA